MNKLLPATLFSILLGVIGSYLAYKHLHKDIPNPQEVTIIERDINLVNSQILSLQSKEDLRPLRYGYDRLVSLANRYGVVVTPLSAAEIQGLSGVSVTQNKWFFRVTDKKINIYSFIFLADEQIPLAIELISQDETNAEIIFAIYGV